MGKVEVNPNYCKACGWCLDVCPKKVLDFGKTVNNMGYHAVVPDESKECVACKRCGIMCPEGAISVYK